MLIDELKKKKEFSGESDYKTKKGNYYVWLSDIEEVLSKATCENCKWLNKFMHTYKYDEKSGSIDCMNIFAKKTIKCIPLGQISTIGCNQWQSKEVKNE